MHKFLSTSAIFFALVLFSNSCGGTDDSPPANSSPPTESARRPTVEELLKRYRETNGYRSSIVKSRARISESDASSMEVLMTVYRARAADGSESMLVEFPQPEQKDRSGLIFINSGGEIEGVRYAQSSNSFVSSKNVSGEDSLFGMSLQELADGQTEKYDFTVAGTDDTYKLEGKLKEGADSKFQRMVVSLDKESFALTGADFYYDQNELARKVTVEKLEQEGGYWTRMRWSVDNRARGKRVEFETLSVKYDQKIPDSVFTRENLKKISSR